MKRHHRIALAATTSLLFANVTNAGPHESPKLVLRATYDTGLGVNGAEIISIRHKDGIAALTNELLGEQRHERGVERALAEQAAKQVGKAEGHEECIRHRARAQRRGDENVAHEAEHAADHGQPAHRGERAVEFHRERGVAEADAQSKAAWVLTGRACTMSTVQLTVQGSFGPT